MKTRLIGFAAAAVLTTGLAAVLNAPSLAQQPPSGTPAKQEFVWPERISNAKVLPADIGAERLRSTMVGFSRSLGVRCTFCHVGEEGRPLSTFDFVSDARPHKETARNMLRLTQRLNRELIPAIAGPGEAGQPRVTCFTCHRGSSTPAIAPPPRPGTPAAAPQPAPAPGG